MAWVADFYVVAWVAKSWERRSPTAGGPSGRVGFLHYLDDHRYVVAWVAESMCVSWERRSPSADGPRGRVGFIHGLDKHNVVAWVAREDVAARMAE